MVAGPGQDLPAECPIILGAVTFRGVSENIHPLGGRLGQRYVIPDLRIKYLLRKLPPDGGLYIPV